MDNAENVPCWICQGTANSREHQFKRSNIKVYFGSISQDTPMYKHTETRLNNPIISPKSDKLTLKDKICPRCNNENTQQYDYAWDTLFEYLIKNWSITVKNGYFSWSHIFPKETRVYACRVHLYFVKSFGHRIFENSVPINISRFSEALLSEKPHNNVFLTFSCIPTLDIDIGPFGLDSNIQTFVDDYGFCHTAAWVYGFYPISIRVAYLTTASPGSARFKAWHPRQPSQQVNLGNYHI